MRVAFAAIRAVPAETSVTAAMVSRSTVSAICCSALRLSASAACRRSSSSAASAAAFSAALTRKRSIDRAMSPSSSLR